MTCVWNALEEFETLIDYTKDSDEHIEKVADRIAKRYNLCAFWNEFNEIQFAELDEDVAAGFENA